MKTASLQATWHPNSRRHAGAAGAAGAGGAGAAAGGGLGWGLLVVWRFCWCCLIFVLEAFSSLGFVFDCCLVVFY